MKKLATLFLLAFAACVPPPATDPAAPAPSSEAAEPEPPPEETYDDGSGSYDDGGGGVPTAPSCGDIACQSNADCPGSCGECSEWSKTCLLF